MLNAFHPWSIKRIRQVLKQVWNGAVSRQIIRRRKGTAITRRSGETAAREAPAAAEPAARKASAEGVPRGGVGGPGGRAVRVLRRPEAEAATAAAGQLRQSAERGRAARTEPAAVVDGRRGVRVADGEGGVRKGTAAAELGCNSMDILEMSLSLSLIMSGV